MEVLNINKFNLLFLTSIILISLPFTAYGKVSSFSIEKKITESILPMESIEEEYIFTKKQAIKDYDCIWSVLEANYPGFNVTERILGISTHDIKESGLRRLQECEDMSIDYFFTTLTETFDKFKDSFHLSILPPSFYHILNEYRTEINGSMTQLVSDWEKSAKVYDYLEKNLYKSTIQTVNANPSNNVKLTIIDEKTAMITIKSFMLNNTARSFEEIYNDDDDGLLALYNEIEGYENLIIDISQNGGGSDWYWAAYIVAPNIVEKKSYTHTMLAKSGEINLQYFNARGIDVNTDLNKIAQLPNIKKKDLNDLDLVHVYTNECPSMVSTKAFNADIYVLIDKPVFSSAESFAMFCKKTGFATLVGKNSYGDGAGYDPVVVSLPESGIFFRYSAFYTLNEDGSCNQEYGTTPDYVCEGTETPLKACLRIIDMKRGE